MIKNLSLNLYKFHKKVLRNTNKISIIKEGAKTFKLNR